MKRYAAMLAVTLEKAKILRWSDYAIEEKFDGHRAHVRIQDHEVVDTWSRSGKPHAFPPHVLAELRKLPDCVVDGEHMGRAGGTFADVRRLEAQSEGYFVVFDVCELLGEDVTRKTWTERRAFLTKMQRVMNGRALRLSQVHGVGSEDEAWDFVYRIWDRGGEGGILKRRAAPYAQKRSRDFVKLKKGGTEVLTVTGFEEGANGPFSVAVLRAADGMCTTVKIGLAAERKKLEKTGGDDRLGARLRIEFTERTASAFVNPHWDRWEED